VNQKLITGESRHGNKQTLFAPLVYVHASVNKKAFESQFRNAIDCNFKNSNVRI